MKKIMICVFLIVAIVGLVYMILINTIFNKNEEMINEYVPEIEISDSELRKTIVKLYFVNDNGEIKSEERLVDSKELLRNPYIALMGMLLEGPENDNFKSIIPVGTKILDASLNKKCVTINLSKEFVDGAEGDVFHKCNMIYTIVNTLTELNEVQSVKFLINGEEIEGFDDESIKLTNEFARTNF